MNLSNTEIPNDDFWYKVRDLKFYKIYEGKLISDAVSVELNTKDGLEFKLNYTDGLSVSTRPNGEYVVTLLKWFTTNKNSLK